MQYEGEVEICTDPWHTPISDRGGEELRFGPREQEPTTDQVEAQAASILNAASTSPAGEEREQDAFEAWAGANGYDMAQHPLHYLFLDRDTSMARKAWSAAIAWAARHGLRIDHDGYVRPSPSSREPVAYRYRYPTGDGTHVWRFDPGPVNGGSPVETQPLYTAEAELGLPAPRPLAEWHEDIGDVLWWKFPIDEPPYVGSPLDLGKTVNVRTYGPTGKLLGEHDVQVGGWPGYHTHWTPIVVPQLEGR
jgi:hypothetical protein